MQARKLRRLITLLTIPAVLFFVMQAYAFGLIIWTWRDNPVSWGFGFTGFGIAAAAFACSLPALAALARSEIHGPLRYLLIAVHTLWFVIGGLTSLFALLTFVFHWIGH